MVFFAAQLHQTSIHQRCHRLIASRYPTVGIFDHLASNDDLHALYVLEGWTNDRLRAELGMLPKIPNEDWVFGQHGASMVMAAFCHPSQEGGRFHGSQDGTHLGAWYASFDISTAIHETVYHHTRRLKAADNMLQAVIQMRELVVVLKGDFIDIRPPTLPNKEIMDLNSYKFSQPFGEAARSLNYNGIVYKSVRHHHGDNVVVYKPKLLVPVKQGGHYEYVWNGTETPTIMKLSAVKVA